MRALQVASAQENVLLRAIGEDQNFPVRHAERVEQRDHLLGARLVVVEVVDDDQGILAGARIERALAGECANLPRYRLDVFASGRTKDSSAAHPLRSAARALPRATRSLLLPRLLVTARHQTTRLGVGEAQALIGQVRLNRLVHDRHVDHTVEQISRQLDTLTLGSTSSVSRSSK